MIGLVAGLPVTLAGLGMTRQRTAQPAEEETKRLWRGVLVGTLLSLSRFWGPLGIAVWWFR